MRPQSPSPLPTNSFSVSTRSLGYIIGTFRIPNYYQEGQVLSTRLSCVNILEYGTAGNQTDVSTNKMVQDVFLQLPGIEPTTLHNAGDHHDNILLQSTTRFNGAI
jgi:hypothetical protein